MASRASSFSPFFLCRPNNRLYSAVQSILPISENSDISSFVLLRPLSYTALEIRVLHKLARLSLCSGLVDHVNARKAMYRHKSQGGTGEIWLTKGAVVNRFFWGSLTLGGPRWKVWTRSWNRWSSKPNDRRRLPSKTPSIAQRMPVAKTLEGGRGCLPAINENNRDS
jgi:hypothetical protein